MEQQGISNSKPITSFWGMTYKGILYIRDILADSILFFKRVDVMKFNAFSTMTRKWLAI